MTATRAHPSEVVGTIELGIAALAVDGRPAAVRLAEWLRLWVDLRGRTTFDAVVGLRPAWGAMPVRDALLGLCATTGEQSARRRAAKAAIALKRYEASGWERDRAAGARPQGQRGLLYDLLSAGCPTSAERIRKLIR
jgi:hypothetical protein